MKLRKRREEEDVITAVLYDDEEEVWKAKYAVDRGVCTIDFGSLDANFMQDTIGRCKRKRRKWVPIPQGSATGNTDQQSAVIQPSQIPTSEPGSVPGDLYNANAFCQRNCFLLVFRHSFSTTQIEQFTSQTPHSAYLNETFGDIVQQHLGVHTLIRDDITVQTEVGFRTILMEPGTSWMLSPVRADGYTGHTVIITNNWSLV